MKDLSEVDSTSRQAFSIKGEIAQLDIAIPEAEKNRMGIIKKNSSSMKFEIQKIKDDLTEKKSSELTGKYETKLIEAVEQVRSIYKDYLDEQKEFYENIRGDIKEFRPYDGGDTVPLIGIRPLMLTLDSKMNGILSKVYQY